MVSETTVATTSIYSDSGELVEGRDQLFKVTKGRSQASLGLGNCSEEKKMLMNFVPINRLLACLFDI